MKKRIIISITIIVLLISSVCTFTFINMKNQHKEELSPSYETKTNDLSKEKQEETKENKENEELEKSDNTTSDDTSKEIETNNTSSQQNTTVKEAPKNNNVSTPTTPKENTTSNNTNNNNNNTSQSNNVTVPKQEVVTPSCTPRKFYSVFRDDFDNFDECNSNGIAYKNN